MLLAATRTKASRTHLHRRRCSPWFLQAGFHANLASRCRGGRGSTKLTVSPGRGCPPIIPQRSRFLLAAADLLLEASLTACQGNGETVDESRRQTAVATICSSWVVISVSAEYIGSASERYVLLKVAGQWMACAGCLGVPTVGQCSPWSSRVQCKNPPLAGSVAELNLLLRSLCGKLLPRPVRLARNGHAVERAARTD